MPFHIYEIIILYDIMIYAVLSYYTNDKISLLVILYVRLYRLLCYSI